MRLIVLQTCVPDYRLSFFSELRNVYPSLRVYAGDAYYGDGVKSAALGQSWHHFVTNRFVLGRRALWQSIDFGLVLRSDVVIGELNPRNMTSWVIATVRCLLRRPTVLWGHAWARSGATSRTTFIRLLMWRMCDAKIVYTVRQVNELRAVLRESAIIPARNALYSEGSVRRRKGGAGTGFIYVGRLVADKKPLLMIESFCKFAKKHKDAFLHVVGAGAEKGRLEKRVEELGITDKVFFHGHVSDQVALSALYEDAVAALSPGYVGLSATQAFFFGVPMIIADSEPHAPEIEACVEGINTVFFAKDDSESMALAMSNVWKDRAIWSAFSDRIQEDVCARYSIEKMVEGFCHAIAAASQHADGVAI